MAKPVTGVLVMAYGTPNRREDILPYYTDIRRGRPPTPEQLAHLMARYEAIGGLSNLNQISAAQAQGIARCLAEAEEAEYRVYQANKHWEPRIPAVVRQMAADGVRKAVALVLAPQGSKMSSGTYFDQIEKVDSGIDWTYIHDWHLEPGFIQALEEKVAEALVKFPEVPACEIPVIFSAHSLPERILTWKDPYPDQLREIAQAVAERLGLCNTHLAYQSASRTPEPWLGPDVADKLRELAESGARSILVCPAGFLSDHLEILYDLDIELQQEADRLGVHLERTGMLNDHPGLLRSLAEVVRRYARGES